jgi:hypothetical protein
VSAYESFRLTAMKWVFIRNLAFCFGAIALLSVLAIVWCRERVKSDLRERICLPISVRWKPFSWRIDGFYLAFKVIYSDFEDRTHEAVCWAHWEHDGLEWEEDRIIDHGDETPV